MKSQWTHNIRYSLNFVPSFQDSIEKVCSVQRVAKMSSAEDKKTTLKTNAHPIKFRPLFRFPLYVASTSSRDLRKMKKYKLCGAFKRKISSLDEMFVVCQQSQHFIVSFIVFLLRLHLRQSQQRRKLANSHNYQTRLFP